MRAQVCAQIGLIAEPNAHRTQSKEKTPRKYEDTHRTQKEKDSLTEICTVFDIEDIAEEKKEWYALCFTMDRENNI